MSAVKSTFAKHVLENVHNEYERTGEIMEKLKVITKGFVLNICE
jgi:hypothetical protein